MKTRVFRIRLLMFLLALTLLASLSSSSLSFCLALKELRVPQEYSNIQEAIDAAEPGDSISVAQGAYQENLIITKNITLKGEGKDVVTVQAANPARPVILIKGIEIEVSISGVAITGGEEGIHSSPFTSLRLNSSEISDNRRDGLIILGQAEISNSEILDNGYQGIKVWSMGSVQIHDTKISGNSSGGLFVGHGSVEVLDNEISDNRGVGIEVWGFAQATIQENRILGNVDGILVWGEAQATIGNNIISDSSRDGVLLVDKAQTKIAENEITKSGSWGIAIWVPECHSDAQGWAFLGKVTGRENRLEENGRGGLCGVPEALKKQE